MQKQTPVEDSLPLKVIGLGRYLPGRVVTNAHLEEAHGLEGGTLLETLQGVMERRRVGGETNSRMGAQAALAAMGDAGICLKDVDLILNASDTREQFIPDGGPLILRELGKNAAGVAGMSLDAGCLGFLTGLEVAGHLLASDAYRAILIVCSDVASGAFAGMGGQAGAAYGDGAAAAVVTRSPEGDVSRLSGVVSRPLAHGIRDVCVQEGGTLWHPNRGRKGTEGADSPAIGRQMPAPRDPSQMEIEETLEALRPGLSRELARVGCVIAHHAHPAELAVYERLGMSRSRVVSIHERLGNCLAASLPLALHEAVAQGIAQRGEEVLLVGAGAGYALGMALLTY